MCTLVFAWAAAGAYARRMLASRPLAMRVAAVLGAVALSVAAAVVLYRSQQVVVGLAYPVGAFLFAWWLMARLERGTAQ